MKATKENLVKLANAVENVQARSAWAKGVKEYAGMLVELLQDSTEYAEENGQEIGELSKEMMLNGAIDWRAYSWGGCALIYDGEIAEMLCSPSELKRFDGGRRRPNGREQWLDVQARALKQAARLVQKQAMKVETDGYIEFAKYATGCVAAMKDYRVRSKALRTGREKARRLVEKNGGYWIEGGAVWCMSYNHVWNEILSTAVGRAAL